MENEPKLEVVNRPRFTEKDRRYFTSFVGGLVAISIVIMQAFISVGKLDISATISVFAIAFALPMLVCTIVMFNVYTREFQSLLEETWVLFPFVFGCFSSLIAIAAALYHVSWVACAIFIVSTIAALIISKQV